MEAPKLAPSCGNKPGTATAGSRPLRNQRWELFCQAVARGLTQTDAYGEAGFQAGPKKVRIRASELAAREPVKARVGWLKARAANRAEIDGAKVLERTEARARTPLTDFVTYDEQGFVTRVTPSEELTPEQRLALRKFKGAKTITYRQKDGTEVTVVKGPELELHDPQRADELLGKHKQLWGSDQPPAVPIQVNVMGPGERK